ncbi:MAG: hypothetical protein CVT77_06505 [Alphaproteobacteria bacterium HGW-Alphaproteobacteria-16]|nr:MAG: hypothetical protein CVT77_06505 [Alphaproteobacteria bacterium HGW-Alphaproteobacteria-16]
MTFDAHAELIRAQAITPIVVLMSTAPSNAIIIPGPELVIAWGVQIPVFSAAAGVLGVVLGQLLAPAPPVIGWRRRIAVWLTLLALVTASAIAFGQMPLVSLSWGIGLGFSGYAVAEALGSETKAGIKRIMDAFFSAIAGRIGAKPKDGQ